MVDKGKAFLQVIFGVGILVGGLMLFALPIGGWAAASTTYTVNSINDLDDGSCDGGHCSLREAINAANNNGGGDTIDFSLPPSSTITLSGFQLPIINDTLTIVGGKVMSLTISGDYASRVFEIGSATAVTITDLTIAKGVTGCFGCVDGPGAGIYNNGGTLMVEAVAFRKNIVAEASAGQPIQAGGAVYNNDGLLTVKGSVFIENQAFEVGGGIANGTSGILIVTGSVFSDNLALGRGLSFADGGGIYNDGAAEIRSSTFIANRAEGGSTNFGGAIANWVSGTMAVDASTFMNNGYGYTTSGGGIHNYGTIAVSNSTFLGNYAAIFGGGFSNFGSGTVSNTTFSGNWVDLGSFGGGIYNEGDGLTINNSTLSENYSILGLGDGLHNNGILQLSNTIIAKNTSGGDCFNSGTIETNITNLIEDGSCNPAFNGDPLLGPLQSNGGPTLTYLPLAGSLAIDNGDSAACEARDQRIVPRPIDGDGNGTAVCDIGAVEVGGVFGYMAAFFKASD